MCFIETHHLFDANRSSVSGKRMICFFLRNALILRTCHTLVLPCAISFALRANIIPQHGHILSGDDIIINTCKKTG